MAGSFCHLRSWLKSAVNGVALLLVTPFALTCWLEARAGLGHEGVFAFWSHLFSLLPGPPGMALRRAYYRLTLDQCSAHCFIGFGALFSHRQAVVEDGVYVGPYALIGSARVALAPGITLANNATTASNNGSATNVVGSVALTPKSSDPRRRVSAYAPSNQPRHPRSSGGARLRRRA